MFALRHLSRAGLRPIALVRNAMISQLTNSQLSQDVAGGRFNRANRRPQRSQCGKKSAAARGGATATPPVWAEDPEWISWPGELECHEDFKAIAGPCARCLNLVCHYVLNLASRWGSASSRGSAHLCLVMTYLTVSRSDRGHAGHTTGRAATPVQCMCGRGDCAQQCRLAQYAAPDRISQRGARHATRL